MGKLALRSCGTSVDLSMQRGGLVSSIVGVRTKNKVGLFTASPIAKKQACSEPLMRKHSSRQASPSRTSLRSIREDAQAQPSPKTPPNNGRGCCLDICSDWNLAHSQYSQSSSSSSSS